METLSIISFIENSPAPIAILDKEMIFIGHSQAWITELEIDKSSVIGKSYYDVIPNFSGKFRKICNDCVTNGKSNQNKGEKFIYPNGKIVWFKWKINAWKDEHGEVGGLTVVQEDITEDKRREELLLKAEEVARIGGWEVDLVTNTIYWSAVTKEIHEVPKDYVPNLEEGINFYKAGKHREEITKFVSDAISNGSPWDTELIIVTAKGKELWVRAKGGVEVVDGKCVRIYGTFQDIDEQKRRAISLKEVNEKLAVATLGAKFGVFDLDLVENSLEWDDSMYPLYGIQKEDFAGEYEAWQSCVHPDDLERCENEINLAISGEKEFNTEFRIFWPNGEIRHIGGIAIIERDANGNALRMIGSNWDVTELKTAQLMLEKSEESFQGAFENSAVGMAMVDLNGQWIKANQSLCASLGYTEEELLKMTIQDITHKEDLKKSNSQITLAYSGRMDSYQLEKKYIHKKGHPVHALLHVTIVRDLNGDITHSIAQILDMTERIEFQKKLQTLLSVTKEQNDSLLNFAHIVSHNLRSHSSNLTMLSGFLQLETEADERNNLLGMLGDASESLSETVMHLNEVVQVKVGALEKLKAVNLYSTLINVKKNLSLLLKEKKAVCTIEVAEGLNIMAIPAYIDSIFLNLLTNSLKYSYPERNPKIHIKSEKLHDKVLLTFSDNGLGIDLKRHGDKLFGMYKTFHRNKDAKGIGLFITKNQIEAMNGKIEVKSTVDIGTTFKIYFDIK